MPCDLRKTAAKAPELTYAREHARTVVLARQAGGHWFEPSTAHFPSEVARLLAEHRPGGRQDSAPISPPRPTWRPRLDGAVLQEMIPSEVAMLAPSAPSFARNCRGFRRGLLRTRSLPA